jgi:hypothetical protein
LTLAGLTEPRGKRKEMDQFLVDYYGTCKDESAQEDDLEKMAQLTLLTKEAAAEGFDLSQLSDEEMLGLAEQLYGGGTPAAEAGTPDLEKEAAEKVDEADFLGRVMAHSFNQELGEIEKQAGKVGDAAKAARATVGDKVTRLGSYIRRKAEQAGAPLTSDKALARARAGKGGQPFGLSAGPAEKAEAKAKRLRGYLAAGGGAGALGAAGSGAYAAGKGKNSSDGPAFNELVLARAYEHLEAAGYDIEAEGAGQEKTAEAEFEETVDRAALQLLEQNGYKVEWVE